MKLVKEMGVYTASSIVEKLLPFLLFPLLTRLLTPEEYGMISMFFVAVSVLGIFVGIGLDNYARVAYHKVKHDQFNNIISNVLTLLLVTVILVGLFVGVLVDSFSVWFGLSGTFVVFAVMLGVFNFVINLRLLTYQTQREPIKFAKIQIARSLVDVGLVLVLVVYLSGGGEERLFSSIAAGFVVALFSLYTLINSYNAKILINRDVVRRSLKFTLPLLPHAALVGGVFSWDKIVLNSYENGIELVGMIAVMTTVTLPPMLIVESVNRAFLPWSYDCFKKNELYKAVKGSYIVLLLVFIVCAVYATVVFFLFDFIVGDRYHVAKMGTMILLWSAFFKAVYFIVAKGIVYKEKVKYITIVTIVSVATYLIALMYVASAMKIELEYYSLLVVGYYFLMALGVIVLSSFVFPQPWVKAIFQ